MGKIIWLASYPKSGNTWLRAFLHNLLRNPKEAYDLNKMSDFTLGDSTGILYQKFLRKPVREMTPEEISTIRSKVQKMLSEAMPDNIFVKTHNALVSHIDRPLIDMAYTAAVWSGLTEIVGDDVVQTALAAAFINARSRP